MEREAEKKEAELQLQRSIRCVKALLVLSSLRPLSNHGENAIVAENECPVCVLSAIFTIRSSYFSLHFLISKSPRKL
ncbi:hypothetical protein Syun_004057 [Stephania yunnanensis]|uniref:Uncharacterized protein n=1 Tax=Stephania yunnanensis TaxID=152371 RepID=A0AAP0L4V7_9MAGN